MLYPLTFYPIFKERVWGGRELERLYGKKLPPHVPVGESWEISDRPGDVSIIANGPLAGKSLRWLMENHRADLLGDVKSAGADRFPLLCKILDAREKLSLQVHPPSDKAAELGGEPKIELWYIAAAAPDAELYLGLKRGVSRAEFEQRMKEGSIAQCFHRIPIQAGDATFISGGRVHSTSGSVVIFEIQQNSDTTFRIFDWNRRGLNGKPRELHAAQSLASIDFNDFEPKLLEQKFLGGDKIKKCLLFRDPLFNVDVLKMETGAVADLEPRKLQIVVVVHGNLEIKSESGGMDLIAGQFCLLPACLGRTEVRTKSSVILLRVEA